MKLLTQVVEQKKMTKFTRSIMFASRAIKSQRSLRSAPYVVTNKKMGNSSNPSTKHYLTKDIFTHIVAAADYENAKDTTTMVDAAVGDTFYLKSNYVVFESVNPKPKVDMADEGKLAVAANLKISDLYGMDEKASPLFFIDQQNNNEITTHPYSNESLGLTIDVMKINPDTRQFTFAVSQKELKNDFVIMKAIIFPYINLVWLGGILIFFGSLMSMWQRRVKMKLIA
jgi:cytochrome c-type biogenesis protein CcmF